MIVEYTTNVQRLMFISYILILNVCTAEKFVLSKMALPEPADVFGGGVYNNILHIINGYPTYTTEYYASFAYRSNDSVSWSSQEIPDFTFEGYLSPNYLYFGGQNVVQIGEIVYGVFPQCANLDYRVLVKYSLASQSYIDTDTYDAVRDSTREGACATYNSQLNVLYIISVYDTEYYDILSDSWSYFTDPDEKVQYTGCAMDVNSQYIFKFGGYPYSDIIEKYDVNTDSWTILSATLIGNVRYLQCLLYENVDDKIYCTGGSYGSTYYTAVHVFDTQSLTVDYESYELNVRRTLHIMVLYDDCLFVIGGYRSSILYDSIEYLCVVSGI